MAELVLMVSGCVWVKVSSKNFRRYRFFPKALCPICDVAKVVERLAKEDLRVLLEMTAERESSDSLVTDQLLLVEPVLLNSGLQPSLQKQRVRP